MFAPVLTPRLKAVADLIPPHSRMVDVGTDHAHLPVYLMAAGTVTTAIACDLRQGPLTRAKRTAESYGRQAEIALRLSNGLEQIEPHEVDTIVVAGMGGETIAQILSAAPWSKQCHCILQPMTGHAPLRQWLISNGYTIVEEVLVREGRVLYVVLSVRGGQSQAYTPGQLWVGLTPNVDSPHFADYLRETIAKTQWALAGIQKSQKEGDITRRQELEAVMQSLIQIEKELNP